jgi:hypothetical protein
MKKCIVHLFILLLLMVIPCKVLAVEGYPGHTWGEMYWEIPTTKGQHNLTLQGWVEQGVYWMKWDNWHLNTYATLHYKWDEEKNDWNNKISPGVGVSMELLSQKQVHLRAGVEYLWERYFESSREEQKVYVYTTWYGWWNLKK